MWRRCNINHASAVMTSWNSLLRIFSADKDRQRIALKVIYEDSFALSVRSMFVNENLWVVHDDPDRNARMEMEPNCKNQMN